MEVTHSQNCCQPVAPGAAEWWWSRTEKPLGLRPMANKEGRITQHNQCKGSLRGDTTPGEQSDEIDRPGLSAGWCSLASETLFLLLVSESQSQLTVGLFWLPFAA